MASMMHDIEPYKIPVLPKFKFSAKNKDNGILKIIIIIDTIIWDFNSFIAFKKLTKIKLKHFNKISTYHENESVELKEKSFPIQIFII